MGMGLSTKAKSSGSCESDRIEEEKNFSQVSDTMFKTVNDCDIN